MAFFNTLSNTTDENAAATLHALLKELRAKVTRETVQETLLQHPDFPSLLSLSDVLPAWQVDNTGLQLNTTEQLRELPLPFIAHLRKNNGWYVLVTSLQGDTIFYTDSQDGRKKESVTDFEKKWSGVVLLFEKKWSGVVLLAETDEESGEVDYVTKRKQEILNNLRGPFVLTGALLITLFVILSVAKNLTVPDWLLLFTKTMGLILSGLLVAKQLGGKNVLADRLCRINDKTNCDDVLNSPAAKLWGWLSWADVGLLYFAGGLLTVWLVGVQFELRPILYGLALLALPYTVFSVYYQGFVLRNWCPLCLGVLAVLVLKGILAITQLTVLPNSIQPYLLLLTAFLVPTLAWVVVKPLLAALPKSRREHEELMQLKRDPNLFRTLLRQQPQMPTIPDDLCPIVLGNPKAEHTITMVTNPYCGPCAKAHKQLDELLRQNSEVKAQIIFLACDSSQGSINQVIAQLMELAKKDKIGEGLTTWNKRTSDENWLNQFPRPENYAYYNEVIAQHCSWFINARIEGTPTIYLNGYRLPEQYQLGETRKFMTNLEIESTRTM